MGTSCVKTVRVSRRTLAALTVVAMLLAAPVMGGRLDSIREDLSSDDRRSGGGHGHHDHDDDDSFLGSLLGAMISGVFEGAAESSHHEAAYADSYESVANWEVIFAPYPYADGIDGYLVRDDCNTCNAKTWSGQVMFQYGDDFDGLSRWGGELSIDTTRGWGFDTEWHAYSERLAGGGHDRLDVGDFNLLYRIAESPRAQWHIGLGMNWLDDGVTDHYGLNFTLKADFFPVDPVVLSGELDWGGIGSLEQFHGSFSAGLLLRRWEIFAGYDYRKIGGTRLFGPMFGARVWF
jgi:hypothetical protein